MTIHKRYLAHIDGIRALAVVPVVLFHLAPSLCPGGFLGVDLFFVISGYLICGGIIRELREGKFTFKSFYFRRIRRIFPAYFALVFGVLAAGVAIYHWARLVPLAQTALFSAGFSTNVYFWLTMGYFQPDAHDNPLLHLWSLGIEEQFYIVIPLVLFATWKARRSWVMPLIFLGALFSLIACVVLGEMGESTTAFYLLPTRAWELLGGALICTLREAKVGKRSTCLGILGLSLVVASYWCLSTAQTFGESGTNVEILLFGMASIATVPFPGHVTIPIIIGTALLIRYGKSGVVGELLSTSLFTGIGKISYSLYLWHWPVFVFGRYISYDQVGLGLSVVFLILSFLCAYFSWRWIEMPVRVSDAFSVRRAFAVAGIGSGILVTACVVLISTDGLKRNLHQDANNYASNPRPFMPNLEKLSLPKPAFKPLAYPGYDTSFVEVVGDNEQVPSFCLMGDSHAEAIAPGLDTVASARGKSGYYVTMRMHPFVNLREDFEQVFQWVAEREEIEDVYLVGRWLTEYRVTDGLPRLFDRGTIEKVVLNKEMEELICSSFSQTATWWKNRGKRVFVFSCVPEYVYAPADIMARSVKFPLRGSIAITERDYFNRQYPISRILDKLAEMELLCHVPLGEAFLKDGETVYMAEDGRPYYRDGDHLTWEGAKHGIEFVAPILWGERSDSVE